MKARRNFVGTAAIATAVLALTRVAGSTAQAVDATVSTTERPASEARPTVVLVHGAWADGSSWSAVAEKLRGRGYTVDVFANPLRGIANDSAYLTAYLAGITGPIVLVGHSYGGVVITNAATGNPNVTSLVYIDAFVPDQGETVNQLSGAQPGSALAVADPSTVLDFVPIPNGGGNVDLYIKAAQFPGIFAAGIPARQAAELAAGQRPLAASALTEPSGVPAWKTIPSWNLIGTADNVIPPAEQEIMATRAKAHIIKINAPHLSMVADPSAVADLIQVAATVPAQH